MSDLQFSVALLNSLSGGNQADGMIKNVDGTSKNSTYDQFSSLLNVLGNIGDANNQVDNYQVAVSKKNDVKDPVATIIDTPVAFRGVVNRDAAQEVVHNDGNNNEQADKLLSPVKSKNDNVDSSQGIDNSQSVIAENSMREVQKTDKLEASADKIADGAIVGSDTIIDDELKAKISESVDGLNNLLDVIAQLLAGAGIVVPVSVVSNTHLGQDVQIIDASVSASVARGATDPLVVFADLRDVLQQLQQFLRVVNVQNSPFTEAQNATLTVINNALQSDLNALGNLLLQVVGSDNGPQSLLQVPQTLSERSGSNTPQPVLTSITDVKSLLQDDISLLKDVLRKFKNDHITLSQKLDIANIKSQIQSQIITSDTGVNDNNRLLNSNLGSDISGSAILESQVVVPVVDQGQSQQISQLHNNTSLSPIATTAIQTSSFSSGADVNTGGNYGQQGGNSHQQFSVGGLVVSSARSAGGAGVTQFSDLLNNGQQISASEQVVFHIKSALGNGSAKITIQLNPDDLGKLDIMLDVDSGGKTGVTIIADNKQTLDLLQRDSQTLQKALADAGLKSDSSSLSFNLRGGDKEGQEQRGAQVASQYQKSQTDGILPEELDIASLVAVTRSYVVNLPDGLNIKV